MPVTNHNPVLFYPIFALAFWTAFVLLHLPVSRIKAILIDGRFKTEDFKEPKKVEVSSLSTYAANNLANLCEIPILFYVGVIVANLLGAMDEMQLNLAWAYVGFRILHSLVHIYWNRVQVRFAFFLFSNVSLVVFWVRLMVSTS